MTSGGHGLLWVRPSRVARRLFFHLFVIGSGQWREPRRFEPFEKPGAGLLWIESGCGQLRLDSGAYELRPGPWLWLYGMNQHRLFVPAAQQTLVTRMFWFGGPGLDAWLEELDVGRQAEFRVRRPSVIHRAYDKMRQLIRQRSHAWEWGVHHALVAVVHELLSSRNVLARGDQDQPEPITRALNALAADPYRDWGARELATVAGLNYSSFRALFREHMRETVHEHLQRMRVDMAQILLSDRRVRIKEIAKKLHFANEHYFSNFFRQQTGMSPTDFRLHLGVRNKERMDD